MSPLVTTIKKPLPNLDHFNDVMLPVSIVLHVTRFNGDLTVKAWLDNDTLIKVIVRPGLYDRINHACDDLLKFYGYEEEHILAFQVTHENEGVVMAYGPWSSAIHLSLGDIELGLLYVLNAPDDVAGLIMRSAYFNLPVPYLPDMKFNHFRIKQGVLQVVSNPKILEVPRSMIYCLEQDHIESFFIGGKQYDPSKLDLTGTINRSGFALIKTGDTAYTVLPRGFDCVVHYKTSVEQREYLRNVSIAYNAVYRLLDSKMSSVHYKLFNNLLTRCDVKATVEALKAMLKDDTGAVNSLNAILTERKGN